MKKPTIPKIPHAFFKWYCKKGLYEELHGDLEEFYYERVEEKGLFKAQLRYLWDVLRCFQPYAWKDSSHNKNSNIAMFKNFYFTTIRNLSKHKSYFLINVSGLAIGIASFTFISLYVINELSYDRFHSAHEQTYRVSSNGIVNGQINDPATTGAPMVREMLAKYPEVLRGTRLLRNGQFLISRGNAKFNEDRVLFADATLFSVFDFNLKQGNPKTALANPRSMVLTESYARKYFGNEDPMGQELTVDEDTIIYKVTGVMEDVPPNSHIQFDLLASLNSTDYGKTDRWIGRSLHAYVVIREDANVEELQEKLTDLFYLHVSPEIEYYTGMTIADWEGAGNTIGYDLEPIKNIHLYSEATEELEASGSISYIYIYGLIGLAILFIAIFNFVNLATAHSVTRAKEVGVRKVIGSTKRTLIWQFIFESVLISFISTLLSILLIFGFSSSFIDLIGKGLAYDLTSGYAGWLAMALLAVLVGLLAGFYPSFVLSSFRPVQVLKGTYSGGGKSGWLRSLLVTAQFTVSIIIIISTLVVYNQIDFMLTKSLGFEKEQILVLKRPDWLNKNLDIFKQDLLKNPNIQTVSNSKTLPGKNWDIRSYRKMDNDEVHLFLNNQVTYEHHELMGLELVAGRFFSKEFASDSNAVILNESAAKALGFDDSLGQPLRSPWKRGQINVIGIIKDYHIESLHKSVAPVSLELDPEYMDGYLSVKMTNPQNVRSTVEFVENHWIQHTNGRPFQYFFFDQEYENLYKSETSTGKILLIFAGLSILIACMGLVGLITYTASIKRREIGIRKVLGAGTGSLIRLLSSQIVRLIALATVLSWPIAYLASDYWLQNFADRTAVDPWIYILSTVSVLIVVAAAIGYQTIKTSLSDPIDSLRQE